MTRGVAHSDELRAEAVGAVLAGAAMAEVARRYGISKGTLGNWLALERDGTVPRTRDPSDLGDLIVDLIESHITAIHAQLQAASRADWLEKQSAAELAQLVAVERDTALRLLAGLRPADDPPADQPRLDAPGAPANPDG